MFTYMHELENLVDTLNEIKFENLPEIVEDDYNLTQEEMIEIVNTIIQLMYDYTSQNATNIHHPSFHEDMMKSVEDLIEILFEDIDETQLDDVFDDETMKELVSYSIELFYMQVMPKRSYYKTKSGNDVTNIFPFHIDRKTISSTLQYLKNVPQPEQRTMEWHTHRHGLITASNAYKALDTEASINQLIYEKCKPITMEMVMPNLIGVPVSNYTQLDIVKMAETEEQINKINTEIKLAVNINTPVHWGQRYEPVTCMYYEMVNNVRVGEYGCITHKKHTFLGASPDGIVETNDSELYGRMLEIKNIVNREITGIPLKAYWVQMQLQMEVCELDKCDFLETRFLEYEDKKTFDNDGTFLKTEPDEQGKDMLKGIMLLFITKENLPIYEYKPLTMDRQEYETTWLPNMLKKHSKEKHIFAHTYYWKLAEISCVLVVRNRLWFELNVSKFNETWNTILKERKTGYEHRAPNKRKNETKDIIYTQCVLDINMFNNYNDDTQKDEEYVIETPYIEPLQPPEITETSSSTRNIKCNRNNRNNGNNSNIVMHIRTESIDETIV